MTRSGTFRYSVRARASRAEAAALLGDLTRQGALHPLVESVRPVPPAAGALAGYLVTDRLAFGPLRFRITYRADVLEAGDTLLRTVAHQRPSTRVENVTRLTDDAGGVRADVEITLSAPAPLFGYAFRQARAAHLALAERLTEALGGPPGT